MEAAITIEKQQRLHYSGASYVVGTEKGFHRRKGRL
jgi:hypothetical protein